VTALERVERALDAAEAREELGAFWALDRERALRAAAEHDGEAPGRRGPLAGVPVAVKDLYDVAGMPTTAGLSGSVPPARADAELVRRLRAAGGVPIGKTAMDPLGASTGGQAPGFPHCLNPLDPALSPGGSSSGSAVAVAAGIVPLAVGSDTAGSTRVPAAYCAIVGLRPALGWLPRRGMVRSMPSFDAPGLLARSVEDCIDALAALSKRGSASAPRGRLTVALLVDLVDESDASVARACREAGALLAGQDGVELREERLDWRAEGFGKALAFELAETWGERVDADPSRFTELIRGTVGFGRKTGRDEYDRALARLSAVRRGVARRVAGVDAVLCPTVPVPAPDRDAESVGVSTSFTRLFNALNWHAVSLPAGRDDAGRPIAVQVAAPPPRLAAMLAVARALELAVAEGRGSRRGHVAP
jgi:Asp-tRNA(Asn)/Glu-tRNA(Gln) amidotransferase A subunit family amidase